MGALATARTNERMEFRWLTVTVQSSSRFAPGTE